VSCGNSRKKYAIGGGTKTIEFCSIRTFAAVWLVVM